MLLGYPRARFGDASPQSFPCYPLGYLGVTLFFPFPEGLFRVLETGPFSEVFPANILGGLCFHSLNSVFLKT